MDVSTDSKTPEPGFTKIDFSEVGTHELIFNNSRAPFNKAALRQAVGLAIDYSVLTDNLGWAKESLQAGFIPLGMAGFKKRDLKEHEAGLKKANEILKKLGYSKKHPFRFTILLSNLGSYAREAPVWPMVFQGAPIEASVQTVSHEERNQRQDRGDFQAMRVIKFAGSVEAHRVFASYLTSSHYNPTRSHEDACDKLIEKTVDEVDGAARAKNYELIDRCLTEKAILIPLVSLQSAKILLRKPWHLTRSNQYLLYPYWVSEWTRDEI